MHRPFKIVVIGPESTGKSTLSAALAAALDADWVPEYARSYLEGIGREYREEDLFKIARGQLSAEESQATGPYLICDTDLYVLKVWSEAKYGRCHRKILEWIAVARADFYLLTDIDMPWADDPLREHPQPAERSYFYHQYKDIVQNSGTPFAIISGNEEARLAQALNVIKNRELEIGRQE